MKYFGIDRVSDIELLLALSVGSCHYFFKRQSTFYKLALFISG